MKIISIFALGILLGAVLGFIIFMNTPLSSRYGMIYGGGVLIKYNTWDGKASVLNSRVLGDAYQESIVTGDWEPLLDK